MKDFDRERDERAPTGAEFRLGGETFRLKDAVPMTVLRIQDRLAEAARYGEIIDVYVHTVQKCLDEGDRDRFRAVIERDDPPVTFLDARALYEWVVEELTTLPTVAPSPSTGGRAAVGMNSTDASSSPEVVGLAI